MLRSVVRFHLAPQIPGGRPLFFQVGRSRVVLRSVVRFHLATPAERAYQQVNCHFSVN